MPILIANTVSASAADSQVILVWFSMDAVGLKPFEKSVSETIGLSTLFFVSSRDCGFTPGFHKTHDPCCLSRKYEQVYIQ